MRLVVEEQFPGCWIAVDDRTYDGPGSPIGSGKTREEAVTGLMWQLGFDEGEFCPVCASYVGCQH
jgi:hypothetical protein